MVETVKRVVLAYKRSFSKKLKRRSAIDRYKARQYYKRNKTKIKVRRKKYLKRTQSFSKSRKLFKRTKPAWMSKRKKPKAFKPKVYKPKKPRKIGPHKAGKIYAPKRRTFKAE
jgi:hypothetical protein